MDPSPCRSNHMTKDHLAFLANALFITVAWLRRPQATTIHAALSPPVDKVGRGTKDQIHACADISSIEGDLSYQSTVHSLNKEQKPRISQASSGNEARKGPKDQPGLFSDRCNRSSRAIFNSSGGYIERHFLQLRWESASFQLRISNQIGLV